MTQKEKLANSIKNLHDKKGILYIPDIEAEVINFICVELFRDGKDDVFSFIEYSTVYTKFAEEFFKGYDETHSAAAQMCVLQNMEWPGIKQFLRDYYLKNHNKDIGI